MQDIVYRKVGQEPTKPKTTKRVFHFPKRTSRELHIPKATFYVEKTLEKLTAVGGWFKARLDTDTTFKIVEPARTANPLTLSSIPSPKVSLKHKVGKALVNHSHKAKESVKKAAHATKGALKTPLGKVTAIQGAVMVGLLLFVINATANSHAKVNPVVPTNNSTSITLHQFLPTASEYVEPAAYNATTDSTTKKLPLYAWVTPWNIDQATQVLGSYASVSAFWLTLQSDGYDFQPKADWSIWQPLATAAKQKGLPTYLTVSGDPNDVLTGLQDPSLEQKQIANLLQVVDDQGFDGIDIDYEGLGQENRDLFTNFITQLTSAFHAQNKLVSVTVEARIGNQVPQDWHALGLVADEIRVMAYDYHSQETASPGPIAPLAWVKSVLDYATQNVSGDKLVIGLGNYGYDWTTPTDPTQSWEGTAVSFDQATALATQKNSPIIRETGIDDNGYDIGSIPSYTYQDDQGKQHSVWFEDAASLEAKTSLVSQYHTKGVIFWSVGLGDSQFWQQSTASTK